jgi:cytochrome c553
MKILKISLILTVFSFCSLVFGFNSSASSFFENLPSKNNANPKPLVDKSAREVYAQNCARCHGADGRGDTDLGRTFDVINIADGDWQKKHSNAKIFRKIARGGGGMPAFAKKLSPQEINALVAYVRALKK